MSRQAVCVVSSSEDIRRGRGHFSETPHYLCTNAEILAHCLKEGLNADSLDDDTSKALHRRLNSWGFQTVFSLIKDARDEKVRDFLDSNLFYIQGLCIQSAKWALALRDLVQKNPDLEIWVPDDGRSFLPAAWEAYLKGKRSGARLIRARASASGPTVPLSTKKILQGLLSAFAQARGHARLRCLKKDSNALLVSGALNHLGDVVGRFRRTGRPVIFLEENFNWDKFKYCVGKGIIFLPGPSYKEERRGGAQDKMLPDSFTASFEQIDLSPVIREVVLEAYKKKFIRLPYDRRFMEALFSGERLSSVLLDEDQSRRRALYVYARRSQKPCHVVSHGIPGTLLSSEEASQLEGRYPSGDTFIHSELEKKAYLSIYYEPRRLSMTGLPRYDALCRLAEEKSAAGQETKILFCGASLQSFDFMDFYPWMGLKNFYGESSERQLQAVVEAVKKRNKPTVLWIKPHYREEELWESAVLRLDASGVHYKIFSHRADVFKLESAADLVVTPESTVIAESLMLGTPVVALNFTAEPLMAPYTETGLIEEVRSPEALYPVIEKCLEPAYLSSFRENRKKRLSFFAGKWDGKNAERVAEALTR